MRLSIILFCLVFQSTILNAQVVTKEKAMASSIMDAMGGKENYNQIRYLQWDFFDLRKITWDKQLSRVRIDYLDGSLSIITYLNNDKGVVYKEGQKLTDSDSIKYYLDRGKRIWMNDSYWLIMPFKLLDPGVRLNYIGKLTSINGLSCDVLELTFGNVGATPENKYHIYLDPTTNLVLQWDYFVKNWEEEPEIQCLWSDYKWYGKIRLASERGSYGKLSNITVAPSINASTFR